MFYLEMDVLYSELTLSLIVTEYRINITDLDYIEFGKRLEPTKNVVAINSNFTHKALDGYNQFISKPKVKRTKKVDGLEKASTGRGRTRPSDHTTFNACTEFTSVCLVREMKPLLMNYRFSINIGDKKFVNLACLANILVADDHIKDIAPFPIQY